MAPHFTQHKIQTLTTFYNALHYLPNPQPENLMTSCPTILHLAVSGKPLWLPDILLKHCCVYSCFRPFLGVPVPTKLYLDVSIACSLAYFKFCSSVTISGRPSLTPPVILKYAHKI